MKPLLVSLPGFNCRIQEGDSMLQTLHSDTKINILNPNLDVNMFIKGVIKHIWKVFLVFPLFLIKWNHWQVFLALTAEYNLTTFFVWWTPGHTNMNCVRTLVHLYYTLSISHVSRDHRSLQWNLCAAHINNFSNNLVECVDLSADLIESWHYSGLIYKFFRINNNF